MELRELYQEIILDHGKNPRNKGKCEGYTNEAKAHNYRRHRRIDVFERPWSSPFNWRRICLPTSCIFHRKPWFGWWQGVAFLQ